MRADCHMHMVLDGVDWKQAIARHQPKPDAAKKSTNSKAGRPKEPTEYSPCKDEMCNSTPLFRLMAFIPVFSYCHTNAQGN